MRYDRRMAAGLVRRRQVLPHNAAAAGGPTFSELQIPENESGSAIHVE
jgi:hypothetical protein